jgi:hypothetical protein
VETQEAIARKERSEWPHRSSGGFHSGQSTGSPRAYGLYKLHPHADIAVNLIGSVDRDDVRMSDARQQPTLTNDRCCSVASRGRYQFERDVAIKVRIPRAIHVARSPTTDTLADAKVPPGFEGRSTVA